MKTGQHLVKSSVTPMYKGFEGNEVLAKHLANTSSTPRHHLVVFLMIKPLEISFGDRICYEVNDEVFMRCLRGVRATPTWAQSLCTSAFAAICMRCWPKKRIENFYSLNFVYTGKLLENWYTRKILLVH